MSSNVLESNPCSDAMLRLLQAMGLSAVRVSPEVVALTTKPTIADAPSA